MTHSYYAAHDDGPCLNGETHTPLDNTGRCPVCNIHPDMQSTILIKKCKHAGSCPDVNPNINRVPSHCTVCKVGLPGGGLDRVVGTLSCLPDGTHICQDCDPKAQERRRRLAPIETVPPNGTQVWIVKRVNYGYYVLEGTIEQLEFKDFFRVNSEIGLLSETFLYKEGAVAAALRLNSKMMIEHSTALDAIRRLDKELKKQGG